VAKPEKQPETKTPGEKKVEVVDGHHNHKEEALPSSKSSEQPAKKEVKETPTKEMVNPLKVATPPASASASLENERLLQ